MRRRLMEFRYHTKNISPGGGKRVTVDFVPGVDVTDVRERLLRHLGYARGVESVEDAGSRGRALLVTFSDERYADKFVDYVQRLMLERHQDAHKKIKAAVAHK